MPGPEELSHETIELERIIRRFESSWIECERPKIDEYLDTGELNRKGPLFSRLPRRVELMDTAFGLRSSTLPLDDENE